MIARQIARSGTSIGANVEEAQAAQSRADFARKMNVALSEARETHYWLRLMAASDILDSKRLEEITPEGHEIVSILTTIVRNTRKKTAELK